jgi:putative thiamine transport system ATP-binding protein
VSAAATTLDLAGVRIALPGRVLVDGLDLVVDAGQCVTLMGPSGCGKSTLLAYVAGSLGPPFDARGSVIVGGVDVTSWPPERRRIGILFQDDLLFPHLSVGGNLAFALHERVRDRGERRARIEAALAEADLHGFAERAPATLSGGQRARVALKRTLLSDPRALQLD